jgi:hypothetical protein
MGSPKPNYTQLPGYTILVQMQPGLGTLPRTVSLGAVPYEKIKHLLSQKPLRRPARTRPSNQS